MTKNENVEKQTDNAAEVVLELRYIDPRDIIVDANVRIDSDADDADDAELVESIRELGVLQPPRGWEAADGSVHLVIGKRRRRASIKADQAKIPVIVAKGSPAAIDRYVMQFDENDRRKGFTDLERMLGWDQMALELGMSEAQIAKRTRTTTANVKKGLKVVRSQTARAAQVEHGLTIDQAAEIAPFEGDDEAVNTLTEVATKYPDRFGHEVQRQHARREREQAEKEASQALAEAGVRVIPQPAWDNRKITRLGELSDAEGNVLTVETHRACPGHAAYLDWRYSQGAVPVYVCTEPTAGKHRKQGGRVLGTPLSPEEKAERAMVRKYTDDWGPATKERRKWLAGFAKRSTAPKGAQEFVVQSLLDDGDDLAKGAGRALAAEWLGGKKGIPEMIEAASKAGKPGRVLQIGLVVALAAIEARTHDKTWRATREARYFLALQAFGYNLDEVERVAAGLTPTEG
jgi:ParB family chromosome partitioning protein